MIDLTYEFQADGTLVAKSPRNTPSSSKWEIESQEGDTLNLKTISQETGTVYQVKVTFLSSDTADFSTLIGNAGRVTNMIPIEIPFRRQ